MLKILKGLRMNSTVQIIKNHRSIRNYLEKDIPEDVLQTILEAAHAMPTSINGQQVSLVVVRDKDTRLNLARLCGGQPWVAKAAVFVLFVADFYKTSLAADLNKVKQVIHESAEGELVGFLDCGISMGGMIIAAESLGLGIVPIGGIRKEAQSVIDLLGLPKYTFPVNGLCIGYPVDLSQQKPRLPFATFIHYEKYQRANLVEDIQDYDKQMVSYLKQINRSEEVNWSKHTSSIYQNVYFPNVVTTLKDQGFTHKK